MQVGIVGFGSFGKFLAEQLDSHGEVRVYSPSNKESQWRSSLQEVVTSDYVILAIPLEAYESVLAEIKPLLSPGTVLIDVASVKIRPVELILSILPQQPLVVTHPLFGPESASDSLKGHTIVLCPENSTPAAFETVKRFCEALGLSVVVMSEKEHDQEMAVVHALTFFIAHSLKDMELHVPTLSTPSFKKLLSLAELEKHHSGELFHTIQAGNPYAAAIREKFLRLATTLDKSVV